MRDETMSGQADEAADSGVVSQVIAGLAYLYPAPAASVTAVLAAGAVLGALGDVLLRASAPPGLGLSLWIAAVAVAALALQRRAALPLHRTRATWLVTGVAFAAGLAWRDAPPLKLLAIGCATLAFALAAHRLTAAWVWRGSLTGYATALALGALHGWTAAVLALVDATRFRRRVAASGASGWRRAAAVARGLLIAAPLVAVFGALFMSADAVFENLVTSVVQIEIEWIAGHIVLFVVLAWLSTGYLRGWLTGTALTSAADRRGLIDDPETPARKGLSLGITEVATALAMVDLLFLLFVIVQFRYLFGADQLIQVTPGLTYADYARRGFFELVFAVVLAVPVLLAADWVLLPRIRRDTLLFRGLAGLQVALVLAIGASALQRLNLYYRSYGLTESRVFAMALLLWIGLMLLWLAATVLRGRRDLFAFGTLASGLATVALLFAVNPDAVVARANIARMASADAPERFDVAYATSLSADAVPVLIEALPALPSDVQCPLARHMLRRWPPQAERSLRAWSWSAARAADAVRDHERQLRLMLRRDDDCTVPQP